MIQVPLDKILTIINLRDNYKLSWKAIGDQVNLASDTCLRNYKARKAGKKHKEEIVELAKKYANGLLTRKQIWEKIINTPGFSKEFLPCTQRTFEHWLYDAEVRYSHSTYTNLPLYREILKLVREENLSYCAAARKVLGEPPEVPIYRIKQFARGAHKLVKNQTK